MLMADEAHNGPDVPRRTRVVGIPVIWVAHERLMRPLAVAGPISMIRNIHE